MWKILALVAAVATALAHPPGAGGLHTTRFEVLLRGPRVARPVRMSYRDRNYVDRIGWKVESQHPIRSTIVGAIPPNVEKSLLWAHRKIEEQGIVTAPREGS